MNGWNLPPGCTQADIDRAFGGDEECYHEAFEIDWEGRAHCNDCDHVWWASADEERWFREANEHYDAYCRRIERVERRREFWRRVSLPIRWPLYRLLGRIWPRKSLSVLTDDEIPF